MPEKFYLHGSVRYRIYCMRKNEPIEETSKSRYVEQQGGDTTSKYGTGIKTVVVKNVLTVDSQVQTSWIMYAYVPRRFQTLIISPQI